MAGGGPMAEGSWRLEIDWTRCEGAGACSELFGERVRADDWGFPIIDPTPIPPTMYRLARRAVASCPVLALSLVEADDPVDGLGAGAPRGRARPPAR